MSSPATTSLDFTTGPGLSALLAEIAAMPDGWRRHPQVPDLMRHVTERYAPLCAANRRPASDAAAAAFHVMRQSSIHRAEDPWGVVTKAVTLEIRAEARAETLMVSVDRARRPAQSCEPDIARAGERDWLLDAGHRAGQSAGWGKNWTEWVTRCARFLHCCGWPKARAFHVADLAMTQATSMRLWPELRRKLRGDQMLAARLGLNLTQWRAIVSLLYGTDPHSCQADLGVIRAVVAGATLPDLLSDDDLANAAAACASMWGR